MSIQLWSLIRDRITPEMPVFLDTDAPNYIDGEENSVIELLHSEFRRLHPTVTRRLALMKKSQRAEQSSLAFLSEVKRDAISSNLRDVDEEALTCMILINGLSCENLRSDLLDLFDVDQDLSLATIEGGIRKYEANQQTSNYVQGQGRKSDLFQVSNYKKTQRQSRKEYALQNYYCDHCDTKGHTVSRCPNKGQDDDSSNEGTNAGHEGHEDRNSKSHLRSITQNEPEVDRFTNYIGNLNLSPY